MLQMTAAQMLLISSVRYRDVAWIDYMSETGAKRP
jgi:hypothetical protein